MMTAHTALNVCHLTQFCHVSGAAGTERYILELVRALRGQGTHSTIAWLCGPSTPPDVSNEDIPVIPIPSPAASTEAPDASFEDRLERDLLGPHRPDVAHVHTFGIAEQRAASFFARAGIPVVFTYHSPAWSCRRQTMLLWGEAPCDGEVRTLRCSACKLHQRTQCSRTAGYLGAAFSGLASGPLQLLPAGGLRRRTAFAADTRRHRTALRVFLKTCSAIVSCAEWSIPVLERNGACPECITHLPQGVPQPFLDAAAQTHPQNADDGTFVIGYVGRVTPVKGTHILIDAFIKCDYPKARLRLLGWEADEYSLDYVSDIQSKIQHDPRIETVPKLPFDAMVSAYRDLSLVAIPSTSLETGPLVLLEALALNVPVWGSNRIGQKSLLEEFGKVINPNTADAWQSALESAFRLHAQGQWSGLETSPHAEHRLHSMADVGRDMLKIYETSVNGAQR